MASSRRSKLPGEGSIPEPGAPASTQQPKPPGEGSIPKPEACTVDHPRSYLDAEFHEKRLSGLSSILVNSKFCPLKSIKFNDIIKLRDVL